jgi:DNA-directed RNA polymerase specialized sigma24 family protein
MKLGDIPRREADEEDVVLSALDSFYQGARAGAFPQLNDRDNLWALLSKITARKAINERLRQLAEKRGGGRVRGESLGIPPGDDRQVGLLAQFPAEELTPDYLVMMREECHRLFGKLKDSALVKVAEMKLAGHTNVEISESLNVAKRTVERKLRLIRRCWSEDDEQ